MWRYCLNRQDHISPFLELRLQDTLEVPTDEFTARRWLHQQPAPAAINLQIAKDAKETEINVSTTKRQRKILT